MVDKSGPKFEWIFTTSKHTQNDISQLRRTTHGNV